MKKILIMCIVTVMCLTSCNNVTNSQNDTTESDVQSNMPITEELINDTTSITEESTTTVPDFSEASDLLKVTTQCTYAAVLDVDKNELIYTKGNINEKMYPASTTKILTSIVALSLCDTDVKHRVGDELDFVQADSSVADIPRRSVFTLDSLLKAMMLPSGNDAAYSVAACAGKFLSDDENVSNKEAVTLFVEEMNRFATEIIGTKGSHFTCPDGYPDDDHYITVSDMMKIARYALDIPEIMNIVSIDTCTITSIPEREGAAVKELYLSNTNRFLHKRGASYYPYVKGMKTGTTRAAGNCLVSYAAKDGKRILCCVFKSPTGDTRYSDSLSLLKAAFGE